MSDDPNPTPDPVPDPPANSPDSPPPADPSPTIADDPGPSSSDVPPLWPENWRQTWAGEDESSLKRLNRWKSPDNVWKAYRALEQKMSSGEYQKAKPDTDDAEVLKAWRTEAGIPETPEGYLNEIKVEVPPDDQPVVDKYLERMHNEGASPKHVQDGLEWYYETQQELAEKRSADDKEFRQTSEDGLRADWGSEYRGNLQNMKNTLEGMFGKELMAEVNTSRTDDGNLLGDNPNFIKMLVQLADEINPAGTLTPALGEDRGANLDGEIAQLEKEMADTKGRESDYWANPAKQQRYRELIQIKDKLKGRAA